VRQHFTGYEADGETGLNFAQARYQSPIQGRFTSVDPLGASGSVADPQSFNRYSYVNNNPTNLTDPTGMMTPNPATGMVQTDDESYARTLQANSDADFQHAVNNQSAAQRGLTLNQTPVGDNTRGDWRNRNTGSPDPENTQGTALPTFNISISGASDEVLDDIQKEMTRIFASGGVPINLTFNSTINFDPKSGSTNLYIVDEFTGESATAVAKEGRMSPTDKHVLGVTPANGNNSYVNRSHIRAVTANLKGLSASIGTMIGRIGAHEIIQHRLLGILQEGTMKDVTSSRITPRELRALYTTRFNLNAGSAQQLIKH
jgi:RHS repeat-associated protein